MVKHWAVLEIIALRGGSKGEGIVGAKIRLSFLRWATGIGGATSLRALRFPGTRFWSRDSSASLLLLVFVLHSESVQIC